MRYSVLNLGITDYQQAYSLQQELIRKRRQNRIEDTVLLLEHNPVITLGKGSHRENLLVAPEELEAMGVKVVETDRGGDVTLHSPGQLVCYPIFDLRRQGRDIHKYLRRLEEVIIQTLKQYHIDGNRIPGFTGVWVNSSPNIEEKPHSGCSPLLLHQKIASIGIGVKHWISYHGFALNVNNNLSYFSFIYPCGLTGVQMTSMARLLKRKINMDDLKVCLIRQFERVFPI